MSMLFIGIVFSGTAARPRRGRPFGGEICPVTGGFENA
jgi:hypothetical protein